jgi:hypothetical protein
LCASSFKIGSPEVLNFFGELCGDPRLVVPVDYGFEMASSAGHYYGHPFYDVFAAYAAFAAASSASTSACEPPRAKKRKLETSTSSSTSTTTTTSSSTTSSYSSADTSRLIFDKRGHVTFRPYSDSLDSPRPTFFIETQSPLNKSRLGLTGSLPTTKSHKGLKDSESCEDKKVPHLECTIGNLFPEILSTIFEYLDVPAKGRAAQVCFCTFVFANLAF